MKDARKTNIGLNMSCYRISPDSTPFLVKNKQHLVAFHIRKIKIKLKSFTSVPSIHCILYVSMKESTLGFILCCECLFMSNITHRSTKTVQQPN